MIFGKMAQGSNSQFRWGRSGKAVWAGRQILAVQFWSLRLLLGIPVEDLSRKGNASNHKVQITRLTRPNRDDPK